jgi:aryl-alcohol dehydrogenase-like predicted oxidoreductase
MTTLALGTMNFGKRTPEAEARAIIDLGLERGVTLLDTANAYVGGESERIVGRAVKGRRESFRIATKVGFGTQAGKPEGLSRARVLAAVDESLERLGTDYVDLYYLHVPDYATPLGETVDAIATVLESKKARAWGVSNYASWQILELMRLAVERGIPHPAISQQLYNLLIRQLDVEYWKFTRAHAIHTTVYNPLAGGMLSGRHQRDHSTFAGSRFDDNKFYQRRYAHDAVFDRVEQLTQIAKRAGLTLVELSYAWLAQRQGVDSILVGPGSKEHLLAAVEAIAKPISKDTNKAIDEAWVEWMGTETTYAR